MKVVIIGNGRFGKVMKDFFGDDVIAMLGRHDDIQHALSADIIILCVPISQLQNVHDALITQLTHQTILEVSSVKIFPQKIRSDYAHVMHTHPMFGPDSVSQNKGFHGLPWVMCEWTKTQSDAVTYVIDRCITQKISMVDASCDEHDRIAAKSQWLAHFIGRMIGQLDITPHHMDTLGAKYLQDVARQTCNDTRELFYDLQQKNPYTQDMRRALGKAYNDIYRKLMPSQKHQDKRVVGIQWWPWSFNELSITQYAQKKNIKNLEIVYLYTTQAVVQAVYAGDVDYGHFAVCNSRGGVVQESIQSIADYQYTVLDVHVIDIAHFLMKKKNTDPTHVMAHPQVFAQCHETFTKKYPDIIMQTWEWNLLDTAACAKALADGEIAETVAILWPRNLASMYDLEIMSDNMADDTQNKTSFFVITRPSIES